MAQPPRGKGFTPMSYQEFQRMLNQSRATGTSANPPNSANPPQDMPADAFGSGNPHPNSQYNNAGYSNMPQVVPDDGPQDAHEDVNLQPIQSFGQTPQAPQAVAAYPTPSTGNGQVPQTRRIERPNVQYTEAQRQWLNAHDGDSQHADTSQPFGRNPGFHHHQSAVVPQSIPYPIQSQPGQGTGRFSRQSADCQEQAFVPYPVQTSLDPFTEGDYHSPAVPHQRNVPRQPTDHRHAAVIPAPVLPNQVQPGPGHHAVPHQDVPIPYQAQPRASNGLFPGQLSGQPATTTHHMARNGLGALLESFGGRYSNQPSIAEQPATDPHAEFANLLRSTPRPSAGTELAFQRPTALRQRYPDMSPTPAPRTMATNANRATMRNIQATGQHQSQLVQSEHGQSMELNVNYPLFTQVSEVDRHVSDAAPGPSSPAETEYTIVTDNELNVGPSVAAGGNDKMDIVIGPSPVPGTFAPTHTGSDNGSILTKMASTSPTSASKASSAPKMRAAGDNMYFHLPAEAGNHDHFRDLAAMLISSSSNTTQLQVQDLKYGNVDGASRDRRGFQGVTRADKTFPATDEQQRLYVVQMIRAMRDFSDLGGEQDKKTIEDFRAKSDEVIEQTAWTFLTRLIAYHIRGSRAFKGTIKKNLNFTGGFGEHVQVLCDKLLKPNKTAMKSAAGASNIIDNIIDDPAYRSVRTFANIVGNRNRNYIPQVSAIKGTSGEKATAVAEGNQQEDTNSNKRHASAATLSVRNSDGTKRPMTAGPEADASRQVGWNQENAVPLRLPQQVAPCADAQRTSQQSGGASSMKKADDLGPPGFR